MLSDPLRPAMVLEILRIRERARALRPNVSMAISRYILLTTIKLLYLLQIITQEIIYKKLLCKPEDFGLKDTKAMIDAGL